VDETPEGTNAPPGAAAGPEAGARHGPLPAEALGEDGRLRVLIVRMSALGDVIHGLPVLHALRAAYPDAEIGWAVEDRLSAVLEGHPEIDNLHVVPRGEWDEMGWWRRWRLVRRFRTELRSYGYRVAIDLQGLAKSAYITRACGAKIRIGFAPPEGRELSHLFHTVSIVPSPRIRHISERNLSLLVPLAVRRQEPVFVLPDFEDARAGVQPFLETLGRPPAILHPGARWVNKLWPTEHFADLARRVISETGMPVVVTGAGDLERSRAEAIVRDAGEGAHLSPPLGLREFVALVRSAGLFVGGDTGPTHLAWASGVPTVGIFGPTSGARSGPLGPHTRYVDSTLGCADCRRRRCPDGTDACMRNIRPEDVFDLVAELIG